MNITFRGFRKDGQGWVEGSHLKVEGINFIVPTLTKMVSIHGSDHIHWDALVPIVPESLSMAVGLQDKNGKQIFTGDNLKDDDGGFIYNNVQFGEVVLGEDEFVIKYAANCLHAQCNDKSGYFALFQVETKDKYCIGAGKCEIIGNQYEQHG